MTSTPTDPLLTAFATVLRRERQRAELSQEELAHRANKSMRYVSLLESCKHQPSLATLKGLCDGMNVTMTEFVAAVEAEIG